MIDEVTAAGEPAIASRPRQARASTARPADFRARCGSRLSVKLQYLVSTRWHDAHTACSNREVCQLNATYTSPYAEYRKETGWRGTIRPDLLQGGPMKGCTVSGGPKSWPPVGFSVSPTGIPHYWGCMIRDEQRGQLSKHPPPSLSWGSGTSDPSASASAPKQVMASVSGKGCPIHMYLCFPGL